MMVVVALHRILNGSSGEGEDAAGFGIGAGGAAVGAVGAGGARSVLHAAGLGFMDNSRGQDLDITASTAARATTTAGLAAAGSGDGGGLFSLSSIAKHTAQSLADNWDRF